MDSFFGFFLWRPFLAVLGWTISAALIRSELIEFTVNYLVSYLADKHAVPSFILFLLFIQGHLIGPALIQLFDTRSISSSTAWMNTGRTLSGRTESLNNAFRPPTTATMRIKLARKNIVSLFPAFFAAISVSAARKVDLRIRTSLCVIYFLSQTLALFLSPFPFNRHALYLLRHIAIGALLGLFSFALLPHLAGRYIELGFHALIQLHFIKQWLNQVCDKFNFWSWAQEDL